MKVNIASKKMYLKFAQLATHYHFVAYPELSPSIYQSTT